MKITQLNIFITEKQGEQDEKITFNLTFNHLLKIRMLILKFNERGPHFVCPFRKEFKDETKKFYTRHFYFNPLTYELRQYITDIVYGCYKEMIDLNIKSKTFNL